MALLLETGDGILLETGDALLLESDSAMADTFTPNTNDGNIESDGSATYSVVRSGNSLAVVNASSPALVIGQLLSGGEYYIYEAFLDFDTSSIPDDAVITSVELKLYGSSSPGADTGNLNVYLSDWGATLTTADWVAGASLSGLTRAASFGIAGWNASGWNSFTEDGTNFQDGINLSGSTRLLLASDNQATGTAPSGNGIVLFQSANGTNPPQLIVTYNIPAPAYLSPTAAGVASVSNLLVSSKSLLTLSQVDGLATVAATIDTTSAINPQAAAGVATAAAAVISRALLTMQADGIALPNATLSTKGFIVPGQVDGVATATAALRSAGLLAGMAADGSGVSTITLSAKTLLSLAAAGAAGPSLAVSTKALLGSLAAAGVADNELTITFFFRPRIPIGAGAVVRPFKTTSGIVVATKNPAGWVVRDVKMGSGIVS